MPLSAEGLTMSPGAATLGFWGPFGMLPGRHISPGPGTGGLYTSRG